MSDNPNAMSGQLATLNIPGVGDFGVTKIEPHRTYVNADTTVTQCNWEQFTPIVRGMTMDVSVPMSSALSAFVDSIFDTPEFTDTSISPGPQPDGIVCTLNSNPSGLETFEATFLIEDYRVIYDSKDAARIVFTLRATGEVTSD